MTTPSTAREQLEAVLEKARRHTPQAQAESAPQSATSAMAETDTAKKDALIRDKVESGNPIFAIIHQGAEGETKEDKIERLASFFDHDATRTDSIMEAARDYLYYVQMVRRTLAVDQIKATSDKIHSSYQQTMDELYKDLARFQDTVSPLREVFELIQKCNREEMAGEAEPLADRIGKTLRKHEQLKQAQALRIYQAREKDDSASAIEKGELATIEAEKAAAAKKWFGSKKAIALLDERAKTVKEKVAAVRAEAQALRAVPLASEDTKDYDPRLLKILDVSGEAFQNQAKTAADSTIAIIDSSQERLDLAIMGLLDVQTRVGDLFRYGNDIDMAVSALHLGVERALGRNQIAANDTHEPGEAKPEGAEALDAIEADLENSRKRRYLASLNSFERSLVKTGVDLKEGITAIEVLDENIRQAIEQAADTRTNTISTVSEAVSAFLQAIVFESNASKIDMISGVLERVRIAADAAQKGQIEMLPDWLRKDNDALSRRVTSITNITDLLNHAADELLAQKQISVDLGVVVETAINHLRQSATELRDVQINDLAPSIDAQQPSTSAHAAPAEPANKNYGAQQRPLFPTTTLGAGKGR